MNIRRLYLTLAAALAITACGKDIDGENSNEGGAYVPPPVTMNGFAEGADISWVTQMEGDGVKFYNAEGKETECTALMKQTGFNAIRLRVWVNPDGGWCGKEDVLEKARRAQALGMRIMIDFHYSDTWADPSRQTVPETWTGYSIKQLSEAVKSHTKETLQLLKDNGIDVEWVQVGNEVNSGMLWPSGKIQGYIADKFTGFVNSGYEGVKEIYPDAKVILHVSNGHDSSLFEWFFNLMKLNGAKYDIIGMSLYPSWWENGGWSAWKPVVDKCIANMQKMSADYGRPVIICETGMPVSDPQTAAEAMRYILEKTRATDSCHGVFYWEPQTDGKWKPASYSALGWNAYDKGAFSNGRPTAALAPFKD